MKFVLQVHDHNPYLTLLPLSHGSPLRSHYGRGSRDRPWGGDATCWSLPYSTMEGRYFQDASVCEHRNAYPAFELFDTLYHSLLSCLSVPVQLSGLNTPASGLVRLLISETEREEACVQLLRTCPATGFLLSAMGGIGETESYSRDPLPAGLRELICGPGIWSSPEYTPLRLLAKTHWGYDWKDEKGEDALHMLSTLHQAGADLSFDGQAAEVISTSPASGELFDILMRGTLSEPGTAFDILTQSLSQNDESKRALQHTDRVGYLCLGETSVGVSQTLYDLEKAKQVGKKYPGVAAYLKKKATSQWGTPTIAWLAGVDWDKEDLGLSSLSYDPSYAKKAQSLAYKLRKRLPLTIDDVGMRRQSALLKSFVPAILSKAPPEMIRYLVRSMIRVSSWGKTSETTNLWAHTPRWVCDSGIIADLSPNVSKVTPGLLRLKELLLRSGGRLVLHPMTTDLQIRLVHYHMHHPRLHDTLNQALILGAEEEKIRHEQAACG